MSAATTPDAWKELCQLLETRKQMLDNALLRTLDDKCPASYFQVARNLLLDHEKMLHWFISQQPSARHLPPETAPSLPTVAKPVTSPQHVNARRAGFLKPAILAFLGFIFFFVIVILALLQGTRPEFPCSGQNNDPALSRRTIQPELACHLLFPDYGFQLFHCCCIMERIHGHKYQTATPGKMDDAPSATRSTYTDQVCITPCHQGLPHST